MDHRFSVQQMLERFKLFGRKPAFEFRDKTISYSQLQEDITAFSERCVRADLSKGSVVILLLPNCYEFVLSFLSLTSLGVLVVPLNPNIREEFVRIARHCQPAAIVLISNYSEQVSTWLKLSSVTCKIIELDGKTNMIKSDGSHEYPYDPFKSSPRRINPGDEACILFTSGITGEQKGVVLSHEGLIAGILALEDHLSLDEDEHFLGLVPLFHGYGLTFSLLLPLWLGAKTSVFESFHPKKILHFCKTFHPTVIIGNPSIYRVLLKSPSNARYLFSRAKHCLTGGSSLSCTDANNFYQQTKRYLHNCYGSTETGTISIKVVTGEYSESVGCPMPAVKVKIVDDDGLEAGTGKTGEIVVNSPWMMKGYFNAITETERVLKNNWYCTGDLGGKDTQENLILHGRKTDMIKTKGFRVFPKEIEDVILQHPMINDAIAFGHESESKGEEIYAVVELNGIGACSQQELFDFCKKRLLDYKIPRRIFIFPEFPKLSNGKTNRKNIKNSIVSLLQQHPISQNPILLN